jgi:hypothetical protein
LYRRLVKLEQFVRWFGTLFCLVAAGYAVVLGLRALSLG